MLPAFALVITLTTPTLDIPFPHERNAERRWELCRGYTDGSEIVLPGTWTREEAARVRAFIGRSYCTVPRETPRVQWYVDRNHDLRWRRTK